jgi:hypothetical protein
MTLSCLKSYVPQSAFSLSAFEAVLADLRDADFDPAILKRALTELAAVEQRLEELADRLGAAYDPVGRGP